MKVYARIQKWGNGLALRVCGPIRDIPSFKEGTEVEIDIKESGFIVKKLRSSRFSLPYSEEDLLKDLTFNKAHGDLLTNPLLTEFDNDE